MLHLITSITDNLIDYIKDDPVRPEISKEFRVDRNRFVAVLVENNEPASIVCVSLHDFIPASVEDLYKIVDNPNTAVFYTIWSYKPGSGALLLREAVKNICQNNPEIKNFVTLSPKTELARRFHLKNGAVIFRENDLTVNYQYSTK
jgi:hypothetical protein